MSDGSWFWLSFADARLPKGSQFLGVVVIAADTFLEAVVLTHALGLNPGGEVEGFPITRGLVPHPRWLDRLLNREEAEALNSVELFVSGDTNTLN